jgi:hypothetical protein
MTNIPTPSYLLLLENLWSHWFPEEKMYLDID